MRLDKAFSQDAQEPITALKADTLFLEGKIKSKFHFECPDRNCNAPVTCANLDRPKEKRKLDPYFKVVGLHSAQCELAKEIESQKKTSRIATDIYGECDEYIDNAFRLNLQPASTKRPEANGEDEEGEISESKARRGSILESGGRKIQRTKTLSSLVDAYLSGQSFAVQLPGMGAVDIREVFVEINGQNIAQLECEWRIYYGKAWFNKKENGYSIVFDRKLTAGDVTRRPATYMPIAALEASGFKRFRLNTLNEIADGKPRMVFLLSETGPRVSNGYINIWCEGPEYLDYRP